MQVAACEVPIEMNGPAVDAHVAGAALLSHVHGVGSNRAKQIGHPSEREAAA